MKTEHDDVVWETPASAPQPRWSWRARIYAGLTFLAVAAFCAFAVLGAVRTASLDVPLPHNVRLGFYKNGAPLRWTCSEGHDHWSMPYWSGAAFFFVATIATARALVRARQR